MWWWFCNLFLSAFAVDNLSSLSGMNKVFCVVALLDQLMRVYSFFQAWLIPRWCTATCPKTLGYHTFTEGLWLWGDSPLSAKPCRPKLRSHKLSICPPCGTVLIGVMRDDLNLHPAFKWTWFPFCNCSRYLWSSVINVCSCLLSEGCFCFSSFFFGIHQSFALLPCCTCVGETWRPLFGIFARSIICDVLIGWSYSSDAARNSLYWLHTWNLPFPWHLIHSPRGKKITWFGGLKEAFHPHGM